VDREPRESERGHKLLTKELREALPALYSTDGNDDALCVVKFFSPYSNWTWWAFELPVTGAPAL
jgi:hypothetical protein